MTTPRDTHSSPSIEGIREDRLASSQYSANSQPLRGEEQEFQEPVVNFRASDPWKSEGSDAVPSQVEYANDLELYSSVIQEHKLFKDNFQVEADTFKLAILQSIQGALHQVPTPILQMKASDFAQQCQQDAQFRKQFNAPLKIVDNSSVNILSSIKNLLASQKTIEEPQPQVIFEQKEVEHDEKEIQCKLSQSQDHQKELEATQQQNLLSQVTFGKAHQPVSVGEEDRPMHFEMSKEFIPEDEQLKVSPVKEPILQLEVPDQRESGYEEDVEESKVEKKQKKPAKKPLKRGKTQQKKTAKKGNKKTTKSKNKRESKSADVTKQEKEEEKAEESPHEDEIMEQERQAPLLSTRGRSKTTRNKKTQPYKASRQQEGASPTEEEVAVPVSKAQSKRKKSKKSQKENEDKSVVSSNEAAYHDEKENQRPPPTQRSARGKGKKQAPKKEAPQEEEEHVSIEAPKRKATAKGKKARSRK